MADKSPQHDEQAGLSGGADVWDDGAAGVILSAAYFEAASNAVSVSGAASASANTTTAGAVTQTHLLAGSNSAQDATSSAGAVVQTHVLGAAPVAVDHIASASAIVQTHILAGAPCVQATTSTAGAIAIGAQIDWDVAGARAIVPSATVRSLVPAAEHTATVPVATIRAVAPASGDDMQPIKTVEQYSQDREVYEIDFEAKYLAQANDTAATLKAVGSDAGITVTPQVAPGGALASGVVKLAVDDPTGPGDYKVWAQIATAAGRERTGVIVVRVEDL